MISQPIQTRFSTKPRLPRKQAMPHKSALHSGYLTSTMITPTNYRFETTSYKTFITIIIEFFLLTTIEFLQYTLIFILQHVERTTAASIGCMDSFFERMTNRNWMWQILRH